MLLFVGLMPAMMWLASGRPEFWAEVTAKDIAATRVDFSCPLPTFD